MTESPKSLEGSIVTITGGTGSFGSTMVKQLLDDNAAEIRVFSRDENKQYSMRNEIRDERVRYFIGDVRDPHSVKSAIKGSDFVFHAAALKQVPSCEFFPMQAVATNVNGSANVIEAAVESGVKAVVCLSTDKAVYPINAMGMSKAMMEKVAQSFARERFSSETRIAITRYGNVMMSRGSVIPLFIEQLMADTPVTITNPEMTRFMMSLSESVELVKYAFLHAVSGDLFVRKAPACTVSTLVEALALLCGKSGKYKVNYIGTRHGEKQYEALVSAEEVAKSEDEGDYYRVPLDTRSLDYQVFFDKGQESNNSVEPFTSHNTLRLNVEQVATMIEKLPEYKNYLKRMGK